MFAKANIECLSFSRMAKSKSDFESGSNPTSCRKYTSEDFRQFLRTTHPENKSDFAKQDKQQIWSVNKLCFAEEDISSEIGSRLLVEQARR